MWILTRGDDQMHLWWLMFEQKSQGIIHRAGINHMIVVQDKDEPAETIAAGIPIVSVSLGDAARFVVGGLSRRDPTSPVMLRSGDVLIMGGPSRLRYHGVTRILAGTAPDGMGPGRFNLTFRQH